MITIITGVPGMGKTALVVKMMMDELEKGERPFFVMGIPDLKLDHSPVPPVIEWTEKRPDPDDPSVLLDYYTFPPNSIIVIDEAQRVFRPRASTSAVPPHVAAQETHRHTGVDFWLLSQKPSLIDSNIRDLTGRHIHLKKGITGDYLYEWPEYQDVKSKTNLSEAIRRKYAPPKESFKYYKSSELHTKQPRRVHQVYFLLAFLLLFISFMGYRVYNGLYKKVTGQQQTELVQTQQEAPPAPHTETLPAALPAKPIEPQAPVELPHPYRGFEFNIKAVIKSARVNKTYYELTNGSKTVFTDSDELKTLGYAITQSNDCAAFLFFNGAQVVATCNAVGNSDTRQGGEFAYSDNIRPKRTVEPIEPPYKPLPLLDGSSYSPSPNAA